MLNKNITFSTDNSFSSCELTINCSRPSNGRHENITVSINGTNVATFGDSTKTFTVLKSDVVKISGNNSWPYHFGITGSVGCETVKQSDGSYLVIINSSIASVDAYAYWFCCIPWWSSIDSPEGPIPVTDIKVGDIVLGYDFKYNKVVNTIVRRISKPKRKDLLRVYTKSGNVLEFTANHAVYTTNGWAAYYPEFCREVDCIKLIVGLSVKLSDNTTSEIVKIEFEDIDETQFYDLSTDTENYFSKGVLVHNAGCPTDPV